MDLKILFSREGALQPQAFWYAALTIYVGTLASHTLLAGGVVSKASIIPFTAAQFACLWAWYAVHAKRLTDAARSRWPALALASLFFVMLVVVLVLLAIFFALQAGKATEGGAYENALAFYLLIAIAGVLFGIMDPTGITPILLALMLLMFGPGLIAIGFTIWTGTRAPALQALPQPTPAPPIAARAP